MSTKTKGLTENLCGTVNLSIDLFQYILTLPLIAYLSPWIYAVLFTWWDKDCSVPWWDVFPSIFFFFTCTMIALFEQPDANKCCSINCVFETRPSPPRKVKYAVLQSLCTGDSCVHLGWGLKMDDSGCQQSRRTAPKVMPSTMLVRDVRGRRWRYGSRGWEAKQWMFTQWGGGWCDSAVAKATWKMSHIPHSYADFDKRGMQLLLITDKNSGDHIEQ